MKTVVAREFSDGGRSARHNRERLDSNKIAAVNLMAAPGAGKTSLILATANRLPVNVRPGAITAHLASNRDAERIEKAGIQVVHIQAPGCSHLEAPLVGAALDNLDLKSLDLLMVENIGDLITPASVDLGAQCQVLVCSVTEGSDKPYKYPPIFAGAGAIVLNKADLMRHCDFNLDEFRTGVAMVNPRARVFVVSCRTGMGLQPWVDWLLGAREQALAA